MYKSLKELYNDALSCRKCALSEGRTNVVFGEGDAHAGIMFIGEGPGGEEDRQGRPFVGRAGQLLDRMIESIGLKRDMVYIANIVKCRPPLNRDPQPEEAEACIPYLREQVRLIRPKIIVCLGRIAAKHIISPDIRITKARGVWVRKKNFHIMPTYHPALLLRDPSRKAEAWQDFKEIRRVYDELRTEDKVLDGL